VLQRHPWIFSGAIATTHGQPGDGAEVDIYSTSDAWLARGTWSSTSQIRVRIFSWDQHTYIDNALLRQRLERAIAGRNAQYGLDGTACRLVYAESDGLPGLVVDHYGDYLAIQLLTQGMAARSAQIVELLDSLLEPDGIYERSDADVRQKEGLPAAEGLRSGSVPPPDLVVGSRQHTPRFLVDVRNGQKTGFYLDQAINRERVARYCDGAHVLDCFCYTGGFTVYAAQAGARRITALDSSAAALETLQAHLQLNAISTPVEPVAGDVFQVLRRYRAEGQAFDVIILDPPKFAHHQGQIERATRGYKDINMLAMHLLRPGGVLATFSCSGLVSLELFQKVVFGAAVDAQRDVQVLERLTQAPDHPVLLSFPESEYLKGFVCRVW
jgi:23S rRNA (cytosine1962-C5)-methyltransferase